MLEGIEVLSKTPITKNPEWLTTLFIIIAIIFAASFISTEILIHTDADDCITDISGYTCVASFVGAIVCLILLIFVRVPTGKYTYKVTIDDSVSMNEFQEKYEIIRTEGKIYTIKEK